MCLSAHMEVLTAKSKLDFVSIALRMRVQACSSTRCSLNLHLTVTIKNVILLVVCFTKLNTVLLA